MAVHGRGTQYNDKRRFIEDGLYLSALRGRDSTGLAMIMELNKRAAIYKRSIPAADFIDTPCAKRLLGGVDNALAVIGHTRARTHGAVDDGNAHPFQYGPITLAHNGTIHNGRMLCKSIDSDVDSAHIAAGIAERGEIKTLEEIRGDFALTWHNAQDGTFNIARNRGRPLFWVRIPEWKGIIWASETSFLGLLLERLGIEAADGFKYPAENTLYKFKLGTKELEYTTYPFAQAPQTYQRGQSGAGRQTHGREMREVGFKTPGETLREDRTGHRSTGIQGGTTSQIDQQKDEMAAEIEKFYQKYSKNKHPRSGRPTSRKAIGKATKALKTFGFRFDTIYNAIPRNFVKYKNQNYGFVICDLVGFNNRGKIAEAHGVPEELFDAIMDHGGVVGRAVGVKNYQAGKVLVLEPDDQWMKYIRKYDTTGILKGTGGCAAKDDDDTILGPNGSRISVKAFEELVEDGCGNCSAPIPVCEAADVVWTGSTYTDPICGSCAKDAKVREIIGIH